MIRSVSKGKTRLLFMTGALFAACTFALPARAQTDNGQIVNQIHELQNQVQTLSRAVYKGDMPSSPPVAQTSGTAASGGAISPAGLSDFYSQLTALQSAQQTLTGQVEKLQFQLQQLTDRVNRMQSDTDERFQQLSKNSVPAPAASPPKAAPAQAATSGTAKTLGTLGGDDGAQTLYENAFADVRKNKYAEAETKFKAFMQQYPHSKLCANAVYWIGEIYYAQGKYKDAARTFAGGYQKYPKSSKAEDSLYKLGLSLSKMDRRADACLSLQQIHKDFPGDVGPLYQKTKAALKKLNCH